MNNNLILSQLMNIKNKIDDISDKGLNTFSNKGDGVGIYNQTQSNDVQFKSLKAGSNVQVAQSLNDIIISANVTGNADTTIDYGVSTNSYFDYDSTKILFDSNIAKLKTNDFIDSKIKYLYFMDDVNFKEEMGHTSLTNTNVVIDNTTKKFGSGSAYFNGTNAYLSIPYNSDLNFASGDYTIEAFVYPYVNPTVTGALFQIGNHQGGGVFYEVVVTPSNMVSVDLYNSNGYLFNIVSTNAITLNSWNHIAVVRNGNNMSIAVNGIMTSGTYTGTTIFPSNLPLKIGKYEGGTNIYYYKMNMDNMRISNVARYTTNFTPPNFTFGTNYDMKYNVIKLKSTQLFDATQYYQINGINIIENIPINTEIKYALDIGGAYPKTWDSSSKKWVDCVDIGTQGMSSTAMTTALTNFSWNRISDKFGIVCALKTYDGSVTPSIDSIGVNYMVSPNTLNGHIITDSSNSYNQRVNLQFKGDRVTISDDTTNDSTVVNVDTSFTYSTNEVWTGKYWIDGKKIYCISCNGTTGTNINTEYVIPNVTIPTSGTVLKISYTVLRNDNFYFSNFSNDLFYVNRINGSVINNISSTLFTNRPFTLVVEYTK